MSRRLERGYERLSVAAAGRDHEERGAVRIARHLSHPFNPRRIREREAASRRRRRAASAAAGAMAAAHAPSAATAARRAPPPAAPPRATPPSRGLRAAAARARRGRCRLRRRRRRRRRRAAAPRPERLGALARKIHQRGGVGAARAVEPPALRVEKGEPPRVAAEGTAAARAAVARRLAQRAEGAEPGGRRARPARRRARPPRPPSAAVAIAASAERTRRPSAVAGRRRRRCRRQRRRRRRRRRRRDAPTQPRRRRRTGGRRVRGGAQTTARARGACRARGNAQHRVGAGAGGAAVARQALEVEACPAGRPRAAASRSAAAGRPAARWRTSSVARRSCGASQIGDECAASSSWRMWRLATSGTRRVGAEPAAEQRERPGSRRARARRRRGTHEEHRRLVELEVRPREQKELIGLYCECGGRAVSASSACATKVPMHAGSRWSATVIASRSAQQPLHLLALAEGGALGERRHVPREALVAEARGGRVGRASSPTRPPRRALPTPRVDGAVVE